MTSKIASVANFALQVFAGKEASGPCGNSRETISRHDLQQLCSLVNSITAKDLGFDYRFALGGGSTTGQQYSAPVMYSHIMENEVFSMGIFVLRPGSRIPLHDHPGMYGVAKVIYGSLRCRSYSKRESLSSSATEGLPLSRWQTSDLVTVRLHQDVLITPSSDACVLTPVEGNYHEMLTVDGGGAAFLDILAPPYDHDLGTRECHFYREVTLPLLSPNQTQQPLLPGHTVNSESCIASGHTTNSPTPNRNNNNSVNSSNALEVNSNSNNSRSSTNSSPITVPVSQSSDNHTPAPPQFVNKSLTSMNTTNQVFLVETPQPKDFWCEPAVYKGPKVS